MQADVMTRLKVAQKVIIYGLLISPLDAELLQLLYSSLDGDYLKEIIILNPEHESVAEKLNLLRDTTKGIMLIGVDPNDLSNRIVYQIIFSTMKSNLTSPEEYKGLFQQLINGNYLDSELKDKVRYLLDQAPHAYHQINRQFFVRASLIEPGEPVPDLKRVSYNLNTAKIPLGRCNFKHQQVLYVVVPGGMTNFHDAAPPAIMETCFQRIKDDNTFDGRLVIASRWIVTEMPMVIVYSHHHNSIKLNEFFRFIYQNFDQFLLSNSGTQERYKEHSEKLEYISGLFCEGTNRENIYRVTSTYFNEFSVAISQPEQKPKKELRLMQ